MAIVVGIANGDDVKRITDAGYDLDDYGAILPLLKDMEPFCSEGETPIAVRVDCDVTDLLVLKEEGESEPVYRLECHHPLCVTHWKGTSKEAAFDATLDEWICPACGSGSEIYVVGMVGEE